MALILVIVLAVIPAACSYPTTFQDLDVGRSNRTSIKFLAIGDWGGLPHPPYITVVQTATAQEMSKIAHQVGTDFVLALGDNFYFKGVDSVDSPRFKHTFEDVYTSKSLNVPWYVLAGNHDHVGNVKAQIDYTHKSARWNFPSYYYELDFRIPNTDKTLTIIMLDTVMLCGNSLDFADQKPKGPPNALDANRQVTWLQERLAGSKADFLLVAGHYPVWSVSEHGPTECLQRRVRPLLLKHNATAYFCGHDHNLQYIEESGVGYVVSGAGNFLDPDVRHWNKVPKGSVKFFTGQASTLGGFVHAEVTKSQMILTFYQAKGTSLYRTVLSPRN
ncbi:tartrate-resistant acid phosphatase type 5a [Nerophis ophidion]|uniref:tartrate-resistant acid phosphatase type 5a n=1 Tax=Nerophis ophidion TaxID=159077 RepID=UPI002AE03ECC|nr:tartrate-resistant acid phosphatase type 5a [Nerophis ophidion]XP_061737366.1 tartrate-resistant acid phosphatase type 5a [Nerophis ophidion]